MFPQNKLVKILLHLLKFFLFTFLTYFILFSLVQILNFFDIGAIDFRFAQTILIIIFVGLILLYFIKQIWFTKKVFIILAISTITIDVLVIGFIYFQTCNYSRGIFDIYSTNQSCTCKGFLVKHVNGFDSPKIDYCLGIISNKTNENNE